MTALRTRHVRSHDGTRIGYHSAGSGDPLLLVHGSLGDHTRWSGLRPFVEPYRTVRTMDRRGRGASGDHSDYDLSAEYHDVAAVVDAIAAEAGRRVAVYCSSFGGLCAVGAAALTDAIDRLALYEAWPPLRPEAFESPAALMKRMEALVAAGRREEALEVAYREVVGLAPEEVATLRAQPSWRNRVDAVHTVPREMRAFADVRFDERAAARIDVPTLIITGSESADWGPEAPEVAAAFPNGEMVVLEGQGHAADLLAPDRVADVLRPFLQA